MHNITCIELHFADQQPVSANLKSGTNVTSHCPFQRHEYKSSVVDWARVIRYTVFDLCRVGRTWKCFSVQTEGNLYVRKYSEKLDEIKYLLKGFMVL